MEADTLAEPTPDTTSPRPPVAGKVPKVDVVHGDRRVDDYFWLRDKSNPEVAAYLQAEEAGRLGFRIERVPRIGAAELSRRLQGERPPLVLDVREPQGSVPLTALAGSGSRGSTGGSRRLPTTGRARSFTSRALGC